MTPDAFMAAICDAPDDDGPRLVFADWLEERGDTARAEFIRVQCELAAMPPACAENAYGESGCTDRRRAKSLRLRSRELLERHVEAWLPAALGYTTGIASAPSPDSHRVRVHFGPNSWCEFRRGFLERVDATAADLVTHAAAILAVCPVREFRSTNTVHVVSIHRSRGGWTAAILAGDCVTGPAWFWRDRRAMLDGIAGVLESRMAITLHRNAGTHENPDWRADGIAYPSPPVAHT